MHFELIVLGVVAFLVLILLASGIKIVNQSTVKIVERLGKYHKTLETGINVIIPFFDKIKSIQNRTTKTDYNGKSYTHTNYTEYIDLRERVFDFAKQTVITKDNVTIEINAMLYYQITDPFKAVYEIEDLSMAIEKLTQTTLRNIIGELELDQTLTSRDTINMKLREILDDSLEPVCIRIKDRIILVLIML